MNYFTHFILQGNLKHYYISFRSCWPPNSPSDKFAIDKYEMKHILSFKSSRKSDKYLFKYQQNVQI